MEGGISLDSIEYYNKNSFEYFEQTVSLDLAVIMEPFISLLPDGASVLDVGCGSGRDSAYLKSLGYDVTAMDGSNEMCEIASVHIGQDVLQLKFNEMDFVEVFDGVWANASLHHVSRSEMPYIMKKVIRSIKPGGVLYLALPYGSFEGMLDGRYITCYQTKELKEIINSFDELELIDIMKTQDVRLEKDKFWISALIRKI